MQMHFLSGGRLRMRRSVYFPEALREELMDIPVLCALIRHPQGNVLFDTGCSPAAALDPQARWGGLAKFMTPVFVPSDTVIGQLPKAGLAVEDIDAVICSHLHADHCGCNEHFPGATILCHADEIAAAQGDSGVQMGYLSADWDVPQGFEAFTGQRDLFGDGRIVILPVPGHSPGMSMALVDLDRSGPFLLASDAVPMEACLHAEQAPRNSWDAGKAMDGVREARRIVARGAQIIHGHDAAQWDALRKGADFYD